VGKPKDFRERQVLLMPDVLSRKRIYIACDLGAESGRVIAGTVSEGVLRIDEVHRFANKPVRIAGSLRWNVLHLFDELKIGLKLAAAFAAKQDDAEVTSVSVDSWGVDYVLLRGCEPLLTLPYHYRDQRTANCFRTALEKIPAETIFDETGIQFMAINTLYQLIAQRERDSELLGSADKLLPIADYFNYLFSGVARSEASIASTTQLYNPKSRDWSDKLITKFELPRSIFPPVVPSATVLGELSSDISSSIGLNNIQVIATCSHDTGAAVAAVPAIADSNWAYLSSGTWSLLGVELPEPLINEQVREANFTNEIGYGGTVRFLKNIVGLWIVQECRRDWMAAGETWSYEELMNLAEFAEPLRSVIQPNDPRFASPGNMLLKIQEFCGETGQEIPKSIPQVVRCIFDSLALSYRQNLEIVQRLTGKTVDTLHIVGGGSRNRLLNQNAADATGITIIAGPVEATAIGNLLLQAIAQNHLNSLDSLRKIVRKSFPIETYKPVNQAVWESAYQKYEMMSK
jgi:rhamnulokinase